MVVQKNQKNPLVLGWHRPLWALAPLVLLVTRTAAVGWFRSSLLTRLLGSSHAHTRHTGRPPLASMVAGSAGCPVYQPRPLVCWCVASRQSCQRGSRNQPSRQSGHRCQLTIWTSLHQVYMLHIARSCSLLGLIFLLETLDFSLLINHIVVRSFLH